MENGPFTVTPLPLPHATAFDSGPDYGAETAEELVIQNKKNVGKMLAAMQNIATQVFYLEWEGNQVPVGAVVGGQTISWAKDGQVIGDNDEVIGTYVRLVEFGGWTGNHHKMKIFLL